MIDPSVRLQRAIHRNDLLLVKRIIKNDPKLLQNPDFADKSNTSLHLAAKLGFLDIVVGLYNYAGRLYAETYHERTLECRHS